MSNKLKPKKLKYTVVKIGEGFRVKDNKGVFITKECPKEIADDICSDFNKMSRRDYTPIGGHDASNTLN